MRRTMRRAGVVVAGGFAAMLVLAAPAAAHVSVTPSTAVQGGFTKLTFRVPNEEDSAVTNKVEVNVPQDTPIPSMSVKPLDGWTVAVTKSKLATPMKDDDGNDITEAVSKIVWTATGPGIQPGQFQEFDVSAGPLPKTDQVVFKALQTYSNGDIVRWIDEAKPGQPEPEHPAPTVKLAKGGDDDSSTTAAAPSSGGSGSGAGVGLGIAGLVFGLAGLAVGILAYRKAASRTT
jgi:uncharacterized protein YcnI